MRPSPFDHRQDHELGEALRSALSGVDETAFVESVVSRAASLQDRIQEDGDWWEVLCAWAAPGLAAAAIGIVAAAAFWWTGARGTANELTDPLQASAAIPAAFLASQPPDLNEVFALELGN